MADKTESKELTPEQEKLLEGDSVVGIKFLPIAGADSGTNGDAKIEVGAAAATNASGGLRKEDLLKFANDPFWVRLRWLLFILFWATWLAMLVGAIYIVVEAPKCPAPEPRLWWEKGQLLSVNAAENGGLKGLTDKLNDIHQFSTGLLLRNVLKSDDYGVVDYKDVLTSIGTLDEFKKFADKANIMGVKIILEININHCSAQHPWFKNSSNKTGIYSDFFVWKDGKSGIPKEPNNWKTSEDVPAWSYDNSRKQFYLHQFGVNQPDLNLLNPDVKMNLKKILRFWIGEGVSGFLFKDASYLVEDAEMKNNPTAFYTGDTTFTNKAFYNPMYTRNQDSTVDLLKEFKTEFTSDVVEPEDKVVFAADIEGSFQELVKFYGDEPVPIIELPLQKIAKPESAATFEQLLSLHKNHTPSAIWPNWYIAADDSETSAFAMALALLPGTFIYEPGTELLSPNTSAVFAAMKRVKEDREAPSINYGGLETLLVDNDVIGYTRRKSGNPGYMVLYNMGTQNVTVDATGFSSIPVTMTAVLRQPDPSGNTLPTKDKVESQRIPLAAGTTIGMTFVPGK